MDLGPVIRLVVEPDIAPVMELTIGLVVEPSIALVVEPIIRLVVEPDIELVPELNIGLAVVLNISFVMEPHMGLVMQPKIALVLEPIAGFVMEQEFVLGLGVDIHILGYLHQEFQVLSLYMELEQYLPEEFVPIRLGFMLDLVWLGLTMGLSLLVLQVCIRHRCRRRRKDFS